jgi:protein-S-isoprenylcysteine O-methyltransferase Ste14
VTTLLARLAYGALFVVLLPVMLIAWAVRLDQQLAIPTPSLAGLAPVVTLIGVALMGAGTFALWRHGHGLPMSAFPPTRLVTRGAYLLFANPLYVGAVIVSFGCALWAQSPAGVWIVTPVLALLATAWVLGFEATHTRSLFGETPRPAMRLPDDSDRRPTMWERVAVVVRVLLPWLIAFEAVEYLGAPHDAIAVPRLPGEVQWPVIPFTEALYVLTYPLVISAPFLARRARDLRRFAIDGLIGTAMISAFYLLVPLTVEAKAIPDDSAWTWLLRWERAGDAPVTAFPAFHVVWTLIAADVLVARWPRARVVITAMITGVAVSCVTTGMHAVLDVVSALLAYAIIRRAATTWTALCRAAERVANSWCEWRIGPIRLLSHGGWAALGGVSGVALATTLAGQSTQSWIVAATITAIIGAGVWAQVVEGSPQLLRPYGFFGAVVGVLLVGMTAMFLGYDGWLLTAAMCTGGCLTVTFGRMRCLVQGCCHGHTVDAAWGIRYTHPRSRVVRLSALGGATLHPTPLYSALWSLVSGAILVRLWCLAVPLPLITGTSFMLAGLGRFVEEHYRGEPQTRQLAGLRLYQWLAVAMTAFGAAVSAVHGAPAPAPVLPDASAVVVWALLFGIIYAAYGIDVPESSVRFSRLV